MEREIKFRAWSTTDKEMVCVSDLSFYTDKTGQKRGVDVGIRIDDGDPVFGGETEYALMQYTGLKDKNGTEVYEGDIVHIYIDYEDTQTEVDTYEEFDAEIIYERGSFWYHGIDIKKCDCNWHLYSSEDFAVIGNVYESPELIDANR